MRQLLTLAFRDEFCRVTFLRCCGIFVTAINGFQKSAFTARFARTFTVRCASFQCRCPAGPELAAGDDEEPRRQPQSVKRWTFARGPRRKSPSGRNLSNFCWIASSWKRHQFTDLCSRRDTSSQDDGPAVAAYTSDDLR